MSFLEFFLPNLLQKVLLATIIIISRECENISGRNAVFSRVVIIGLDSDNFDCLSIAEDIVVDVEMSDACSIHRLKVEWSRGIYILNWMMTGL